MKYQKVVEDVVREYKDCPIDILGIGDVGGEYDYMSELTESYARTVRDIDQLFIGRTGSKKVLEIGAYLGPVSLSLKRLGFDVFAQDIPEFSQSPALQAFYQKHEIPFVGCNLRTGVLPYESDSFDVVIACEVFEHLNFNPLPALEQVNRVLKSGAFLYMGMPNQASIFNRIKLCRGRSIHNNIKDYFKQLDRNDNMIVGLHWREYTMQETEELFERMGFDVVNKYYFQPKDQRTSSIPKALLKRLLFAYPPFRGFQVVIGKKESVPAHDFWRTEANS